MSAVAAILIITLLCFVIGLILTIAARRFALEENSVTAAIESLLPQTQCAQCGYPGCQPYANAIANKAAPINQCPPGGVDTIARLAKLLDRPVIPLNSEFGETKPESVALIIEQECIGCTLCIHACPVDAIVGAGKHMHTVIAADCTGCELCIPPCPVDCIDMIPMRRQPA